MSEQSKPEKETVEQKQKSPQGDKSIKSRVGSLRVRKTEKPKTTKEPTIPIRKRKRLQ
jgi:hypothetical protein